MRFIQKLMEELRRLRMHEVGIYAVYASFFIILAFFPAMMLLTSLLQYTPVSPDYLQDLFSRLVPETVQPLLNYMIDDLFSVDSAAILSVSVIVTLWMASKGFYALHQGLNMVYSTWETRNFIQIRLRCMGFTLLFFFLLLFLGTLQLLGRDLLSAFGLEPSPFLKALLHLVRMRYLLFVAALTLTFAGMYCVFPNRPGRFAAALPGALAAALLWIAFSRLFTLYVENFGNYSFYYGSLAVIAMAMLWLYVCMYIFLCGGVLNCELERLREKKQLQKAASKKTSW